ncbi:MAG: hypothetical protein ACKVZH_29365 [Blastocatellia bacterium]
MSSMSRSPHYIIFRNYRFGKRIFKLRIERARHTSNCKEHGFAFGFDFNFRLSIEKEGGQSSTIH